jgi:hypothetical protein
MIVRPIIVLSIAGVVPGAVAQDCAWMQSAPIGSSIQIQGFVSDTARSRLVLLGYVGGSSPHNQTWERSGSTWTQRIVDGLPPRVGYGMAYDSGRSRTVLFGGYVGETWEWDGVSWTQVAFGGPTSRAGFAIAYDSSRARVMLFGGGAYNAALLNDLWTALSGGRYQYQPLLMAEDTSLMRLVSVNGSQGETWEFNPAAPLFPPAITQSPMGYPYINPGQSITFHVEAAGTPPPSFQWTKNAVPLANSATISGTTTDTLSINPVSGIDSGMYQVQATNPCGSATGPQINLFVTEPPPSPCYANCDNSTIPPILNPNDFQCFLDFYFAGLPYANCDRSSTPPILNINDFQCFLNAFAAGCS